MSGRIRQSLATFAKNLKDLCAKKTPDDFEIDPVQNEKKNLREARLAFTRLEEFKHRISNKLHDVRSKMSEWEEYMDTLEDEELTKEQKTQIDFFEKIKTNLDNELGTADDLLIEITGKMKRIEVHVKELEQEVANQTMGPTRAALSTSISAATTATAHVSTPRIRLPTLQPEPFMGEPEKWPIFWQIFDVTINSTDITNVEKFAYLRMYLGPEPMKLIEAIAPTDENYETTVQMLKERYGRPELVETRLLDRLQAIRGPTVHHSSLRAFTNECTAIYRQLEAIGTEVNDVLLTKLIQQKLPPQALKPIIIGQRNSKTYNVKALLMQLENMTQEEEEVSMAMSQHLNLTFPNQQPNRVQPANRFQPPTRPNFQRPPNPQHRTNVVNSNPSNPNQTISTRNSCLYCNDSRHRSHECRRFQTNLQRTDKLQQLNRCIRCLKPNHEPQICTRRCYDCNGDHHSHICPLRETRNDGDGKRRVTTPAFQPPPTHRANLVRFDPEVVEIEPTDKQLEEVNWTPEVTKSPKPTESNLLTLYVDLFNPETEKTIEVVALLDPGSTANFVTEKCRRLLHLPSSGIQSFATETFGSGCHQTQRSRRVTFGIRSERGDLYYDGYSVPSIISSIDVSRIEAGEISTEQREPDVLIGRASIFQFIGLKSTQVGNHEVLETNYGPCVTTPDDSTRPRTLLSRIITPEHETDSNLTAEEAIRLTCHVEKIGLEKTINNDKLEEEIRREFEEKLHIDEHGRYVASWLWNGRQSELPTNFGLAYNRLTTLFRRLDNDSKLKADYKKNFDEWATKDVTEKVTTNEPEGIVSYLPHQAVLTPQKTTTKLRVVIDASAKTKTGLSLNDCQYRGPLDLPQIVSLGIRSRFDRILVTSDVEKAFLSIGLEKSQRDAVRFLLPINWNERITHSNLQVWRFQRVPFGVIASPSILGMVLNYHLRLHDREDLIRQVYVDNVIETHNDESKAIESSRQMISLLATGQMNLREFHSNSPEVAKILNPTDESEETKILGIGWNKRKDELTIKQPDPLIVNTKREALSHNSQTYDPLGLTSPSIVTAKLFVQKLWIQQLGWDEPLPEELKIEWKKNNENRRGEITFPRFIGRSDRTYELHSFCDASKEAYGAANYLIDAEDHTLNANLIFAKLRLAPKGNVTEEPRLSIPRLELQATIVALKNIQFLQTELADLKINRIVLWSDAKSVLQQIQGTSEKITVFVKNRLKILREARKTIEFRHVPGTENPADLLSRGCDLDTLRNSTAWWHGPAFLRDEKLWPTGLVLPKIDEIAAEEHSNETSLLIRTTTTSLFDIHRHSWDKNVRIVQRVIEFLHKKKLMLKMPSDATQATKILIREAQRREPPSLRIEKKLRISEDSTGLVRCRTRLVNAELPTDTKAPIWLPRDDAATKQLILSRHEHLCHAGVQTVTASLRRNYWLTTRTVKNAIAKCQHCRLHNVKPFSLEIGDLPTSRTRPTKPFEATGLDYLGPLHASNGEVFVLLATCMTTRAIHLEVVPDQTTRRLVEALESFYSRRGTPKLILSDNGTSLIAASQIFRDRFANENRKWITIPPRAPWFGGFYERLVMEVKRGLKRSLGRSKIDLWTLRTLVTKIESIVNERPLLAVTEETDIRILRPVDFLRPHGLELIHDPLDNDAIEDPEFILEKNSKVELKRLHETMEKKLNWFWETWSTHYLTSLLEKAKTKQIDDRTPRLGQVVIIGDNQKPRSNWKIGIIENLISGRDGKARTAEIRVIDEKRKTSALQTQPTTILKRAVEMLYELECEEPQNEEELGKINNEVSSTDKPGADETTTRQSEPNSTKGLGIRRSGRKRRPPLHWRQYVGH